MIVHSVHAALLSTYSLCSNVVYMAVQTFGAVGNDGLRKWELQQNVVNSINL